MKETLKDYLQQEVVVDTSSSWIYIGMLESVRDDAIELSDVDVHENMDTRTSKEIYILDSKRSGVKSNRKRVFINLDYIVSFSPLDDVIHF